MKGHEGLDGINGMLGPPPGPNRPPEPPTGDKEVEEMKGERKSGPTAKGVEPDPERELTVPWNNQQTENKNLNPNNMSAPMKEKEKEAKEKVGTRRENIKGAGETSRRKEIAGRKQMESFWGNWGLRGKDFKEKEPRGTTLKGVKGGKIIKEKNVKGAGRGKVKLRGEDAMKISEGLGEIKRLGDLGKMWASEGTSLKALK